MGTTTEINSNKEKVLLLDQIESLTKSKASAEEALTSSNETIDTLKKEKKELVSQLSDLSTSIKSNMEENMSKLAKEKDDMERRVLDLIEANNKTLLNELRSRREEEEEESRRLLLESQRSFTLEIKEEIIKLKEEENHHQSETHRLISDLKEEVVKLKEES